MPWTAIERYGLAPAPGPLAAVHEFLSTSSAGRPRQPDLLSDLDQAQTWIRGMWPEWAATVGLDGEVTPVLEAGGLRRLRRLRDAVRYSLDARDHPEQVDVDAVPAAEPLSASVSVSLLDEGAVDLRPRGAGGAAVVARLLLQIRDAQLDGSWARVKTCRNPRCRGAFYDRSRNNSGVWHDVHTCGNAANLRASRARRRERSAPTE